MDADSAIVGRFSFRAVIGGRDSILARGPFR
jgi:hypothetical protein